MKNWKVKSILVPFDFLPPSVAALAAAKRAAARWNAQIELLHVRAYPAVFAGGEFGTGDPLIASGPTAREIKNSLKDAAGDFPKVRTHILDGDPEELVRRLGKDAAADLVVMGTHGYKGLDHLVMSSVTESVVRSASVPVMTMHAGVEEFAPKRILAPVNFSEHAGEALAKASLLAREFGAKLHLIHAIEPWSYPSGAPGVFHKHLERTAGSIRGIETTTELVTGGAVDSILRCAAEGGFDLVVLAAHRRFVFKEWMVGTTVERVLRHSEVPVLAVPSESRRARGKTMRAGREAKIAGLR
jgi:nucleotide-binding universal stress UspA family protein